MEDLAESLRPYTATTTRIEMAPWAKAYTVPVQDIYTELTLEKIENQPTGPEGARLRDYQELFPHTMSEKEMKTSKKHPKKVLMKGDPGTGKTVAGKKISWDWAMGLFKMFTIVLFVSLKLVRPGDAIENIIMQQTPALEGLGITQKQLENILEAFGIKCLLILDGIDEIDLRKNEEIMKVIKDRKLLYCNVLVTSRPHSAAEIEPYFDTVVKIQGFSEDQAGRYVSSVLRSKQKTDDLLQFYFYNFRQPGSSYASPMLLLFICILVNADEIDLEHKNVMLGEIYARLVRYLYRKFTVHKGVEFNHKDFEEVLNRVGKLAWDTLDNKQFHLQRSKIIRVVGEDAFEYGLLIGHEDFSLVGYETADIFVTFLHGSFQDFLGSFHFISTLNKGEGLITKDIASHDEPVFMINSAFLNFCLWFLCNESEKIYLAFNNRIMAYKTLALLCAEMIDVSQLDFTEMASLYPSLHLPFHNKGREGLLEMFLLKVLSLCQKMKELYIGSHLPVDWIFENYSDLLSSLQLIDCSRTPYRSGIDNYLLSSDNNVKILVDIDRQDIFDKIVHYFENIDQHPSIYLMIQMIQSVHIMLRGSIGKLCIFVSGSIEQLGKDKLTAQNITFEHCPFLTVLSFVRFLVDGTLLIALSKAGKEGKLPVLTHLSFEECGNTLKRKLCLLLETEWPKLTHLNLKGCYLDESDIQELAVCLVDHENGKLPNLTSLVLDFGHEVTSERDRQSFWSAVYAMFQFHLSNIQRLHLYNINEAVHQIVGFSLSGGFLPNLIKLAVSFSQQDKQVKINSSSGNLKGNSVVQQIYTAGLSESKVPLLVKLKLHRVISSQDLLNTAEQNKTSSQLHKLDISHSSGITGNLSAFLRHSFPSLNNLILSNCRLNSKDLCSLAQASVKGRLPQLKHLDIAKNRDVSGRLHFLFFSGEHWQQLLSLNIQQETFPDKDIQCLANEVRCGHLSSVQKLWFCFELFSHKDVKYLNLGEINFSCGFLSSRIFQNLKALTDAVERDLLPKLHTVRIAFSESVTVGKSSSENTDTAKLRTNMMSNFPSFYSAVQRQFMPNMHIDTTKGVDGEKFLDFVLDAGYRSGFVDKPEFHSVLGNSILSALKIDFELPYNSLFREFSNTLVSCYDNIVDVVNASENNEDNDDIQLADYQADLARIGQVKDRQRADDDDGVDDDKKAKVEEEEKGDTLRSDFVHMVNTFVPDFFEALISGENIGDIAHYKYRLRKRGIHVYMS